MGFKDFDLRNSPEEITKIIYGKVVESLEINNEKQYFELMLNFENNLTLKFQLNHAYGIEWQIWNRRYLKKGKAK